MDGLQTLSDYEPLGRSSPNQAQAGCVSPNPEACPAEFSWKEHFHRQHTEARARMARSQAKPVVVARPDPEPETARRVYLRPPGPYQQNAGRQVYGLPIGPFPRPSPSLLIGAVAHVHGLTASDLTGPSRQAHVVLPRQECYWRMREQFRFSLPEIGQRLGGRDHTTVLHGIRKYQALLARGEAA